MTLNYKRNFIYELQFIFVSEWTVNEPEIMKQNIYLQTFWMYLPFKFDFEIVLSTQILTWNS